MTPSQKPKSVSWLAERHPVAVSPKIRPLTPQETRDRLSGRLTWRLMTLDVALLFLLLSIAVPMYERARAVERCEAVAPSARLAAEYCDRDPWLLEELWAN